MIIALLIIGFLLVFFILPSIVITLMLFWHRSIRDFDERGEMRMPSLLPYIDTILADMAYMRSLPHERIAETASDGIELKAEWYPNGSSRTVIMLHGFRTTPLNNFSCIGRAFYEKGWNLLLVYQRGHNVSGGRFTLMGLREQYDLLRWIDRTEKLVPGGSIAVYGVSMGGAAAAYASDKLRSGAVRSLVIDCSYLSPADQMFGGRGPLSALLAFFKPLAVLNSKLLLGVDIRQKTTDSLKRSIVPAVFITSLDDRMVTPRSTELNFEACASEKELIKVESSPHALAFTAADEQTRQRIFDFIDRSFLAEAEK